MSKVAFSYNSSEVDSKTAEIIFVVKGFSLIIAFAVLIKDSPILLCEIINRPTLILKFLIFFTSNQLLNNFLIYFSIGLINFSCRLANISVAL